MEEMDSKPYQPLSKGRHEMEMSYTSSSDESEDGRTHHRSYTSRETLPDYTHELRLTLGSHRERQSNYSQPQQGTRSRLSCYQGMLRLDIVTLKYTSAVAKILYVYSNGYWHQKIGRQTHTHTLKNIYPIQYQTDTDT